MHAFTKSGLGPGTLIDTPDGPLPVEWLEPGYPVMTRDHGAEPTVWIGTTSFRRPDEIEVLRPVHFSEGALGPGIPSARLIVSPFHKVLIDDPLLEEAFSSPAMFVTAQDLVGLPGVSQPQDDTPVHFVHVALDFHRVLMSNGVPVESLLVGTAAMAAATPGLRVAYAGRSAQEPAEFPVLTAAQVEQMARAPEQDNPPKTA